MSEKERKRFLLKIVIRGRTYTIDLSYLKENWGAPFIIAFMVMLITCAYLLAYGNEAAANGLAVYAYYSLVIGVVLQLTVFIREKRGRSEHQAENDP